MAETSRASCFLSRAPVDLSPLGRQGLFFARRNWPTGGGATILCILWSVHILEQFATDKSYHLCANVDGKDEVARLANRFNQMLERIEAWDKKLITELDQSRATEIHLDALARTDEFAILLAGVSGDKEAWDTCLSANRPDKRI